VRFVLVPGAGGSAWYWKLLAPLLGDAVAIDLPADDETKGLPDYAALVRKAMNDSTVVVAQSLGGFTAALVADQAKALVFVNAMIPNPHETAGDWWANTGHVFPKDFTPEKYFLHDVPKDTLGPPRDEAKIVFRQRCDFDRWPDIPMNVIVGKDDRFFPPDFQRRVAKDRLGLDPIEIAGGHLVALSNPKGLADAILAFAC